MSKWPVLESGTHSMASGTTACHRERIGPVRAGWAPSVGCCRDASSIVSLERFPNSAGIGPVSWLLPRAELPEAGEVPQLGGNRPRQLVAGEVHSSPSWRVAPVRRGMGPVSWLLSRYNFSKLERLTQLGRDGPCQLVVVERQLAEAGEVDPTRRESAPSVGCCRGTAVRGWRGSPTRREWAPSVGCCRATAS